MSKLNLEDLTVDSFDTTGDFHGRGTVYGLSLPTDVMECGYTMGCGDPTAVGAGWTCQNTCNHEHGTTCQTAAHTNEDTCCNTCDYCRPSGSSCHESCTA